MESNFRTIRFSDPRFERDGLRHVTVKSPSLRRRGDLLLHVPAAARGGRDLPLVILLHGVYGSHWSWALSGGAHHTAERLTASGAIPPVVLAMPSDGLWGDGSGYVRHADHDVEGWIVEEVPRAAAESVAEVGAASPLYLAGLSMGGYGALRLGARHAARFRGVSAHSAITDLGQLADYVEEPLAAYWAGGGDLSVLAALREHRDRLPPIRFDCGRADPLLEANRALHRALVAEGIAHRWEEFPGGHEWSYWETHLEVSLRFFAELR